jgi:rhodanese-related sulfurtransferase
MVKITHDLSGFSIEKTTTIDATTAKELFDRGVPFIDVRSDKSWADGHIQSATHIKLGDDFFEANLSALLGKDDEVVFYSRGPMCGLAPNASAYAVGWGYSKVYYLRDGFPGWKTEEFPTEP